MLRQNRVLGVLIGMPITFGGLLLVLVGCGMTPPTTASLTLPPTVAEGYPPHTTEDYVPPPLQEPWPTALPEPTATPRPSLDVGRVVRGWGNFPRLPVVATREDGVLALYIVQGDAATLLVDFEDSYHVDVLLSPSGRYVACHTFGEKGSGTIEWVDTLDPHRLPLYQSTRDATLSGGRADWPTSFAWLDDTHLLYTVGLWSDLDPCVREMAGQPCLSPGELWVTDLNGVKQRLLTADRLSQVLGVSPDGQRAYFVRLGKEWVPAGPNEWYDLYSLDLTSGVTATLWPQANNVDRYTGYTLLPFPDGGQRILFRPHSFGSIATAPVVIQLLDPESGRADVTWMIAQGEFLKEGMVYDTPTTYLWSPFSEQHFVYDGIWWVDLAAQRSHLLREERGQLLTWTAEGIVVHEHDHTQRWDVLRLLDTDGQLQGEIDLSP